MIVIYHFSIIKCSILYIISRIQGYLVEYLLIIASGPIQDAMGTAVTIDAFQYD